MSVEVSIINGPLRLAFNGNEPEGGSDEAGTSKGQEHTARRPKRKHGLEGMTTGSCVSGGRTGAVVVFEGVVRSEEDGQRIDALNYTAYEPMATMELTKLARNMLDKHGLNRIAVEHSRGRVAAGEVSFRLSIWSPHRKESLAAMADFIDRMKQDVPIWKKAVGSDEVTK